MYREGLKRKKEEKSKDDVDMGGVGRHIRLHQISWVGRKGKAKCLTHEQARTRAEAESQSTVASGQSRWTRLAREQARLDSLGTGGLNGMGWEWKGS